MPVPSRDEPFVTAAAFLTLLGPVALPRIRLAPDQLSHRKDAFTAEWTEALPLPVADQRSPHQIVALADSAGFTRVSTADDIIWERRKRPRTQVYESLDVRSDSWLSLVTLHLAGLLRRRVICTAYESYAGDRALDAHDDAWLGVIVQMRGAKHWLVWPTETRGPEELITRAGDVMILPHGMKHEVSTPDDPGCSVHLVFAVTDEAIDLPPGAHQSASAPTTP